MEEIFKNYDKVLSLGTSCYIKSFLQTKGIIQETNLFDNIGSSMWGICELFENDFEGLSNLDNFDRISINDNLNLLTNKKYYLRFKHEDYMFRKDNRALLNLLKTLDRRASRFKDHLENNKKILFIRLEQDDSKRTLHPEYVDKNNGKENEFVIKFSRLLKEYYKDLDFLIIHISKGNLFYDTENNIVTLPNTYEYMTWNDCNEKLNVIFNSHIDFIESHLI